MESVKKRIQEEILQELDMTREVSDEELLSMIQQKICDIGQEAYLSVAQRMELQRKIFYGLRRLDVLEDLLADETITEIMVNGPDTIFVERSGHVERTDLAFSSAEKLEDVIQRIVASNNKMANTSHPIVDTRLADGSRINIVLPPIALDHSVLSIRKFPKEWITMEKLVEWQALSLEVMAFIKEVVQCGYNIFVSGGTGSGKTTLLNCISTIDRVTAGKIIINNQDITRLKGNNLNKFRREELGFIFQDFNLLDTLTAYENIALALTIQKVKPKEIEERVQEIAKKLEITDILNKYPYQISGGQKQRVASARAIITNPKLVLADEPTGALDSKSARQLLESFENLNQKLSATILMVTHDSFTASYASRILFIKDGKIFNELIKGESTRKEFFEKIIEVQTLLGGELGDVI